MINEIESKVKKIMIEKLELVDEISVDNSLESQGINSISFIKLLVDLETEFDIEFEDEELSIVEFNSVKDIVDCIIKKKGGK